MPSFSKPFRLVAPGLAVAYSALLVPSAQAQNAPITPVGDISPTAALVPSAPASASSDDSYINLNFQDVDVAELLSILSNEFNVQIIVRDDVNVRLKSINVSMSRKTPEKAISKVAFAAGLEYRLQDGTYIVGKTLPADPNAVAPITAPALGFTDPSQGFGSPSILPGGSAAGNQGSALGAFGTDMPSLSAGNRYDATEPSLVNNTQSNKNRQTSIKLRNVSPSMMAFWLDPDHHDMPVQFQVSQKNTSSYGKQPPAQLALGNDAQAILNNSLANAAAGGNGGFGGTTNNPYIQNRSAGQMQPNTQTNFQFGGGFGGGGGGGRGGAGGRSATLELPGDIEQIIAVDPQNILLVAGGTDDDIRRLQEIINVLDRPLRQVEIEAQFVQVTITDTRQFGIDFNSSQGNFDAATVGLAPVLGATSGGLQLGFVRGNFQATLSALIAKDRAKLLTAPRVLAINNLTAQIRSDTSTPIVLQSSIANGGLGGGTATSNNVIYITTSIQLNVTPTINNDDTITVLMQPELSSQQPGSNSVGAPSITQQSLTTVANVRDGDTIALGGLRLKTITRGGNKIPVLGDIPLIGKLFNSRRALDNDDQLIIFLKATIVRRAGDDEPVPGT